MHAQRISFVLCALCLAVACEQALGFAPSSGEDMGLDHHYTVETGIDGVDALDLEFEDGLGQARRQASQPWSLPAQEQAPIAERIVEKQAQAVPEMAVPAAADDSFAVARKAQAAAAAAAAAPASHQDAEAAAKAAAAARVAEVAVPVQNEAAAPVDAAACALAVKASQAKIAETETQIAALAKDVESLTKRAAAARTSANAAHDEVEASQAPAVAAKERADAQLTAVERLHTAVSAGTVTPEVSMQVDAAVAAAPALIAKRLAAIHEQAKQGTLDRQVLHSQLKIVAARIQRESERAVGDAQNKIKAASDSVATANKLQASAEEQSTLLTAARSDLSASRLALSQLQAKCSA